MLDDYIQDYIRATKENDKKSMDRIERDLRKLGMDKLTLKVLVNEALTER